MLEIEIPDASGNPVKYNSNELMYMYGQQSGMEPQGLTPDGTSAIFKLPDGQTQQVNLLDTLQQNGKQIASLKPMGDNVNYDNVDTKWRFAIENLEDPDARQVYLKSKLQKDFGIKDPQIVGSGTDYFVFNPANGQYHALTNKPGMDFSDIATIGNTGARIAGATAGGALGAAAGLGAGSIATGALGAAAGHAATDAAIGGIVGGLDEDYRNAFNLKNEWKGRALGAGLSGVGGAVGPALGVAKGLVSAGRITGEAGGAINALTGLERSGIATPIAKGVGGAAETVGNLGAAGSKLLNTDIGRMGLEMGLDPTGITGMAQGAAFLPQLPSMAARGLQWVGKKVGPMMESAGTRMTSMGAEEALPSAFGTSLRNAGQAFAKLGQTEAGTVPEHIVRNYMARFGRDKATELLTKEGKALTQENLAQAMKTIEQNFANRGGATSLGRNIDQMAPGLKGMGEKFGSTVDAMERGGEALGNVVTNAEKAALKGSELGFRGMSTVGKGLNRTASALQPYEMQGIRQYGAQKAQENVNNVPQWELERRRRANGAPLGFRPQTEESF